MSNIVYEKYMKVYVKHCLKVEYVKVYVEHCLKACMTNTVWKWKTKSFSQTNMFKYLNRFYYLMNVR